MLELSPFSFLLCRASLSLSSLVFWENAAGVFGLIWGVGSSAVGWWVGVIWEVTACAEVEGVTACNGVKGVGSLAPLNWWKGFWSPSGKGWEVCSNIGS